MNIIALKKAFQSLSPMIVTFIVAALFGLWRYESNVNEVNQTLLNGQKELVQGLSSQMAQLTATVESTAKTNESIRRETLEITTKFRSVHDGFARLEEQLIHGETTDSTPPGDSTPGEGTTTLPELELAWTAFELASQGDM